MGLALLFSFRNSFWARKEQHSPNNQERKVVEKAVVWYGVAGEGLGHSIRSSVMIERLRAAGYRVLVFGSGEVLRHFATDPDLRRIPGLVFHRKPGGRISKMSTFMAATEHAFELLNLSSWPIGLGLDKLAAREGMPKLVISDFEPFTSRWARRHGVPLVTLDHQHFLTEEELPQVSNWRTWIKLILYMIMVNFLSPRAQTMIVSSFSHFPARFGSRAIFVGCLISDKVKAARVADDGHICVYLKSANLIERIKKIALANPERQFVVWSKKAPSRQAAQKLPANMEIKEASPIGFIESLSTCTAVICTSGNQLLAEAIYYGKPIWAVPVPGELEQWLNAKALQLTGGGKWSFAKGLTPQGFADFWHYLGYYKAAIAQWKADNPDQIDGTQKAVELILKEVKKAEAFRGSAGIARWLQSWMAYWLTE